MVGSRGGGSQGWLRSSKWGDGRWWGSRGYGGGGQDVGSRGGKGLGWGW